MAVQFHIISEHGAPPLAQPFLSPCHVTGGNTSSPGCMILPSVNSPDWIPFFPFQLDEHVGLFYHRVDGTSKLT